MTVAQDSPAVILAELDAAVADCARRGVLPPKALTSAILDLHKQLEVLDRHRQLEPLPEGSDDAERVITIRFDLSTAASL